MVCLRCVSALPPQTEDVMTRLATTLSRKRERLPGSGRVQQPLANWAKPGAYWLETMGCQVRVLF
jgi:hypothetical protein